MSRAQVTAERLAEILARLEMVTKGSWYPHGGVFGPASVSTWRSPITHSAAENVAGDLTVADASFIANAPDDIRDLLAALSFEQERADAALAERDALKQERDAMRAALTTLQGLLRDLHEGDDGVHRPDRHFGIRTLSEAQTVVARALGGEEG